MHWEHITLESHQHVSLISLNRPEKSNALNEKMWFEIPQAIEKASESTHCRAIILKAEGKNFCAGIDFGFVSRLAAEISPLPEGYKQEKLYQQIRQMQAAFNALENCPVPIIAAVQGHCIGAGLDLIACCDLRYATEDASFAIKEVDLAIVADMGSLQRLPHLITEGVVREWAYTGRSVTAQEAQNAGLLNKAVAAEELLKTASETAEQIAKKSPLTIRGIKHSLNFSREHTTAQGLDHVALWNAGQLFSSDAQTAAMATMTGKAAVF